MTLSELLLGLGSPETETDEDGADCTDPEDDD